MTIPALGLLTALLLLEDFFPPENNFIRFILQNHYKYLLADVNVRHK